jgi:hypothetical protein
MNDVSKCDDDECPRSDIPDDPFFLACLRAAATPELVAEFDRLSGANLARRGTPLDLMIDDATGRAHDDMGKFVAFVRDCIYTPILGYKPKEGGI